MSEVLLAAILDAFDMYVWAMAGKKGNAPKSMVSELTSSQEKTKKKLYTIEEFEEKRKSFFV